jgi:type I restriction enzyme S subunit
MKDWTRTRVKWLATEVRETVDPAAVNAEEVFHYSIPSLDAVGDGIVEPVADIGSDKLLLRGGEVLVSKLNPRISRVLIASSHAVPTLASTEFIALVPGPEIDSRFLCYWLASEAARQFLDGATMSVTRSQQRVRPDVLTGRWVNVPGVRIQRTIANYLDREMARIDSLVAAKRQMMRLLYQQLQSYIDRAIRAEPRPGVSSAGTVIGDVPANWEVMHLRRIASIYSGTTFPHDYQGKPEGDYPLYKVADLASPGNETWLFNCENWITRDDLLRLRGRIVPADSIVFPRVGAALLLNARRISTRPSLVDDNSRALNFARGDIRYWRYMMTLIDFGRLANPGAVPTIGEEAILSLRIPVPPDAIQRRIADAIDSHYFHYKKLRDVNAHQIILLQERRKALITAAVTGQLEIAEVA